MRADMLHVVAVMSNPCRWETRITHARRFIEHMLDSGVNLTVVETAYGERPFELDGVAHIRHVATRARSMAWSKESAQNAGLRVLPPEAKYVCLPDMDIEFQRKDWAAETVQALQFWPAVQPWNEALDLDARGQAMVVKGVQVQHSFAWVWRHHGDLFGWTSTKRGRVHHHHHHPPKPPPLPTMPPPYGGHPHPPHPPHPGHIDHTFEDYPDPPPYPHCGYAWAYTMDFLNSVGLLLDRSGVGAGDHQMSLGYVGMVERALPTAVSANYRAYVQSWGDRAYRVCQGHIGYVIGRVEHFYHGSKENRKYGERWEILRRHNFDPYADLHQNRWGILELSDNKPEFRREVEHYFADRDEDSIGGPR